MTSGSNGPAWRRYLRFWGSDYKRDLDDELTFHIESRVQEYVRLGMTPDEARVEAVARFGNVAGVRDACERIDKLTEQERSRANMWESFTQDLRYAGRALRRSPGFTLIAVLTLGLGIGANTAIFSVVNGVLLRPLPYPEPERLVRLYTAFRGTGTERYTMSQPEFMDYKSLAHVFENAGAYTGAGLTLTGSGEPERITGLALTRDVLPTLGIVPARGRNFEGDEGRQGSQPVVIVTHELWQNRFGGDPALLGSTLNLNGIPRTVVGILPRERGFMTAQAFIPLFINPDSLGPRTFNNLQGVARLRPGITLEQAQNELNALTRRSNELYPRAYPANMGYGANVVRMIDVTVGDIRPALVVLLGAVGLVLLIACANVANLLLARASTRQQEMSVRLALGAGRGRVVRQLLTESMVLALLGGAAGAVFAYFGLQALLSVNPEAIPRYQEIRMDVTVGVVTLGIALLTGLLFGLAPALQMVRPDLQSSLKEGGRGGSSSAKRQRVGRTLVAAEIALAVVVVVGAALLMRSFWQLRSVDPGFDPDNMLVVDVAIPPARYDVPATVQYYRRLAERMAAIPGVRSVAAASDMPPVAGGRNWDMLVQGRSLEPDQSAPSPNVRVITREYWSTMGIGAARGRLHGREDTETGPLAIVVNEATANAVWPGEDPVGARVQFGDDQWFTVIGVARDTRSGGLGEPVPSEVFILHEQMPRVTNTADRSMYVILRTGVPPTSVAAQARDAVREMDALVPIIGMRSMGEIMDRSVAQPRFTMLLLGVFGSVALVLSAIGIYGIMAYAVKRRTREIGIRMALGAAPRDVLRMVVGQGMRLTAVGLGVGIATALLATRMMESLLFGVSRTDPATFAAVVAILAGVALLASWLPARRAVATDPTSTLRAE